MADNDKSGDGSPDKADGPAENRDSVGAEALGVILSRLGGIFGKAQTLLDDAAKSANTSGHARTESKFTMRTLDGEETSLSSIVGAFQNAREGQDNSVGDRPLRQVTPDFVMDTPGYLVALVDLPGVVAEDVDITVDGDVLVMKAAAPAAEYWAEILMPRDVSAAKQQVSIRNGILRIVWTFPDATP